MEIRLSMRRKLTDAVAGALRSEAAAERRSGMDRRGWHPMPAPPFSDSSGVLVSRDRRKVPDRRIGNIKVNWRGDDDAR
jgi:hypothetical protein